MLSLVRIRHAFSLKETPATSVFSAVKVPLHSDTMRRVCAPTSRAVVLLVSIQARLALDAYVCNGGKPSLRGAIAERFHQKREGRRLLAPARVIEVISG